MEIYHGKNFRVNIGKDLMRTYIKYLENQGYVTSKTGRRYYIIGKHIHITIIYLLNQIIFPNTIGLFMNKKVW